MDIKRIWLFVEQHKGQTFGILLGLLLGFIYLWFGFWKMLFFSIILGLSYLIGVQFDRKEDVKQMIDNILLDKFMRK
ncbi:Small integral membrane protein [Seinonella peptonophila]|uniref:Small integral membrane protein n=1 Tax=Seinonella peptonophila TaxID=112248 RepID=A0A1M4TM92_9BACL|nr:DUF2273 domain-containing protein [Seinonella peptonophila]SHE45581.1 Small integral membrane protein [Seinonella peptonophila]